MPIQINCELDLEPPLSEKENDIIGRTNAKLRSLKEDMTEKEMEQEVLKWMDPLRQLFPQKMSGQDLKQYVGPIESEPTIAESRLIKNNWSILNKIWGWKQGNHSNFENVTHCGIHASQCWTDPIMRILSRGYSYSYENAEKASSSTHIIPLKEYGGIMAKSFALWSVYFEEPEVLPLIRKICTYRITRKTSYTMTMLVMFTRAWIEYCLLRDPIPLLENILELHKSPSDTEDEFSLESSIAIGDGGLAATSPVSSPSSPDKKRPRQARNSGGTPPRPQTPQSLGFVASADPLPTPEGAASASEVASTGPPTGLSFSPMPDSDEELLHVSLEPTEDFSGAFGESREVV